MLHPFPSLLEKLKIGVTLLEVEPPVEVDNMYGVYLAS